MIQLTNFSDLDQDEDVLQEVCKEIIEKWSEAQDVEISEKKEGIKWHSMVFKVLLGCGFFSMIFIAKITFLSLLYFFYHFDFMTRAPVNCAVSLFYFYSISFHFSLFLFF